MSIRLYLEGPIGRGVVAVAVEVVEDVAVAEEAAVVEGVRVVGRAFVRTRVVSAFSEPVPWEVSRDRFLVGEE